MGALVLVLISFIVYFLFAVILVVLQAAIRRATLSNKFCPVFMGSAYKNKGARSRYDACKCA